MDRLSISIIAALLFAIACGELSRRKSRNIILWAILGFLFGFIPLLILVFMDEKSYILHDDLVSNESNFKPEGMPEINFDIEKDSEPNNILEQQYAKRETMSKIVNIIIIVIIIVVIIAAFVLKQSNS
ncbi:MAG: hypothetical protein AB1Z23_12780 [Eubacteriales bacterium]